MNPVDKPALRRELRARLDAMPADQRAAQSAAICAAIRAWPPWSAAHTIMAFAPTPREADITPLLLEAAAAKRICIPAINWNDRSLEPGVIRDWNADLIDGPRGVKEPRPGVEILPPAELDLVLAPGLAFDLTGGRLGQGAGLYDRFLPRLSPRTHILAVALDTQIISRVPREPHDLPVPWLVTPSGVVRAG